MVKDWIQKAKDAVDEVSAAAAKINVNDLATKALEGARDASKNLQGAVNQVSNKLTHKDDINISELNETEDIGMLLSKVEALLDKNNSLMQQAVAILQLIQKNSTNASNSNTDSSITND